MNSETRLEIALLRQFRTSSGSPGFQKPFVFCPPTSTVHHIARRAHKSRCHLEDPRRFQKSCSRATVPSHRVCPGPGSPIGREADEVVQILMSRLGSFASLAHFDPPSLYYRRALFPSWTYGRRRADSGRSAATFPQATRQERSGGQAGRERRASFRGPVSWHLGYYPPAIIQRRTSDSRLPCHPGYRVYAS